MPSRPPPTKPAQPAQRGGLKTRITDIVTEALGSVGLRMWASVGQRRVATPTADPESGRASAPPPQTAPAAAPVPPEQRAAPPAATTASAPPPAHRPPKARRPRGAVQPLDITSASIREERSALAHLKASYMYAASRLDSVWNSLSGMGDGDKGSGTQVDMQRVELSDKECRQLWRFNGYADRIVGELPMDVSRAGWAVNSSDVPVEQQPMLAEEVTKNFGLVVKVREAMTWARLSGNAAILVVCDERVPPSDLNSYLMKPLGTYPIDRIVALHIIERCELSVYEYEGNPNSKHYRLPKSYIVTPRVPNDRMAYGKPVHASRFMMFAGRSLPPSLRVDNNGFDDSVLQKTADAIFGRTSIDMIGNTLAQEMQYTVLTTPALGNMDGREQLTLMREQADLIAQTKSTQNLILLREGETLENRSVQMQGFGDLSDSATLALCAAANMPATRLFGEAPAGLNTDGDSQARLWEAQVVIAQEGIKPQLRQFYDAWFASAQGPTGGKPIRYDVVFPPATTLSATEEATLRLTVSQADQAYITAGVFTPHEIQAVRGQPGGWRKDIVVQAAPQDERQREADLKAELAEREMALIEEQAAAAAASQGAVDPAAVEGGGAEPAASVPSTEVISDERLDAEADSAVIWIEFPDEAAQEHAQLVRSIEQNVTALAIEPETKPHITLLYLGVLRRPQQDVEVIKRVMDEFGKSWPVFKVVTETVMTFPPHDDEDRHAVTLAVREGDWHLERINAHLTRRLAHLIQAEQFAQFKAHATLGYARLSAEVREEMMQQPVPPIEFTATRLRLVMNSKVVHETVFPGHGWPGSIANI